MADLYGLPVNPEPWTVPDPGIGRRKGKVFVTMAKSKTLIAFQEAIRDEMSEKYPKARMIEGPVQVDFWLWRNLAEYQGARKKVHRNAADATNMQKALEDALQGVLYPNDSNVVQIRTRIVEQGPDVEGFCMIQVQPWVRSDVDFIALHSRRQAEQAWPTKDGPPTDVDRTNMTVSF